MKHVEQPIANNFAVLILALSTGCSRKDAENKIINHLTKIKNERIRLFGK